MTGALVVVGTGIAATHLTQEARAAIVGAETVFFLVGDPLSEHAVLDLSPDARSLAGCYEEGGSRRDVYERMVETMLAPARAGKRVCAAFYGHPGVFVFPSREAIVRARAEGIDARMLPGISALDCLFADLGLDPAESGCQTYEAADFLRRRPTVEPRAALVLWQVGVIGEAADLASLVEALVDSYPPDHEIVAYEASSYPGVAPLVRPVKLAALDAPLLSPRSTVYVPPLRPR